MLSPKYQKRGCLMKNFGEKTKLGNWRQPSGPSNAGSVAIALSRSSLFKRITGSSYEFPNLRSVAFPLVNLFFLLCGVMAFCSCSFFKFTHPDNEWFFMPKEFHDLSNFHIYQEDIIKIKNSCGQGDLQACTISKGWSLAIGRGVEKNTEQGRRLLQEACDQGILEGCTFLAHALKSDAQVEYPEKLIHDLYQSACVEYHWSGCAGLGWLYVDGIHVKKDIKKAVDYFELSCSHDSLEGCFSLGMCHLNGKGVKKDGQKATEIFSKAAKLGSGRADLHLSLIYLVGRGRAFYIGTNVKRDKTRALEHIRRSCEQNFHPGCIFYSGFYYQGYGVKKDRKRALRIMRDSCSKDYGPACYFTGDFYRRGRGVKKNPKKAAKYFQKACDCDWMLGCFFLGEYFRGSALTDEDRQKAQEYYEKACRGGHEPACRRVE
jgi:TPR repeat protein